MNYWNVTDDEAFSVGTDTWLTQAGDYVKTAGVFVLFVTEGTAELEINLCLYRLRPHTQTVLLPGSLVHVLHVSPDFKLHVLGCSDTLFHEISTCLDPRFFHFLKETPCVPLDTAESVRLQHAISLLHSIHSDTANPYRRHTAANCLHNLLYSFYSRTHRHCAPREPKWVGRKEELFKLFLQLVHQYCTTQREVAFYARKMNITPRYLSTIVLAMSKESTKSIIDRHAIAEIKVMLKSTRLNIQEISNRMKFADQSFFGRYFKKHTGISPIRYRNKQ